jgi:hypothetical protein
MVPVPLPVKPPAPSSLHGVPVAQHHEADDHRARRGQGLEHLHPREATVFLPHADAQAVGDDGHFDQARRGGQREQALRSGLLVNGRGLGAGAGHELAVDAHNLGADVAQVSSSAQGHRAVVGCGIGHGGVSHDGLACIAGKCAVCGRAGEGLAQRIGNVAGDHGAGVVHVPAASAVGEGAVFGLDRSDAHVLLVLGAEALVFDEHQRAPDGRRGRAGALKELDAALALDVVFKQIAIPLRPLDQVVFDGRGNVGAPVKRVALCQGDGHVVVVGDAADDDVGTKEAINVRRLHMGVQLPDVYSAARAVNLAHVGENGVAVVVRDDGARWSTAALWHIVHDFGRKNFDVARKDSHVLNLHEADSAEVEVGGQFMPISILKDWTGLKTSVLVAEYDRPIYAAKCKNHRFAGYCGPISQGCDNGEGHPRRLVVDGLQRD